MLRVGSTELRWVHTPKNWVQLLDPLPIFAVMSTETKRNLFGETLIEPHQIDRDLLARLFCRYLKNISAEELVALLYSIYEAIIDYAKLCQGEKTGEKISMLFNPHRYATSTRNSISIIDALQTDSFLTGLARATLFKEGKCKELLYQVLQLGINGIQYVNEFPPAVARDFYMAFGAQKILDPCAGWGGRMVGAASIGAFYHGFEPATKTYGGLLKLGQFLQAFDNGFSFRLECVPFEDAKLSDVYDLALTSPPYYDTERYSDEDTQSYIRYSTPTEWVQQFFIPMIEQVSAHTKRFVLNVGNRAYPLQDILLLIRPDAKELSSKLSGGGGLGKAQSGKERFFLLESTFNE